MGQELTEIGWLKNGSDRLLRQWKTIEFEQPRPESGADVAAVPSSVTQSYYTRCTMARIWVVVSLLPLARPPEGLQFLLLLKIAAISAPPILLSVYSPLFFSFYFSSSFYLFPFLFSLFFLFSHCWFRDGRI